MKGFLLFAKIILLMPLSPILIWFVDWRDDGGQYVCRETTSIPPPPIRGNPALALFTQWELQRESPLTWCEHGDGFEVWCAAVDHYMDEVLRDFPEKV